MHRRSFLASIAGAVIAPHLRIAAVPKRDFAELFGTVLDRSCVHANLCGPPLSIDGLREALKLFDQMASERGLPLVLQPPLYIEVAQ